MKKILLFFAMLVTVTAGYAQDDKQCCGKCNDCKEGKECKECKDCKDKASNVEQLTADMVSQLQLDEKQAAQLKALNEEYAEVLRAPGRHHGHGRFQRGPQPSRQDMRSQAQDGEQGELQQAPQMSRREARPGMERRDDGKREQMRAKRAEYEQKLNGILTADQQEKWRSLRPAPRGMRRR